MKLLHFGKFRKNCCITYFKPPQNMNLKIITLLFFFLFVISAFAQSSCDSMVTYVSTGIEFKKGTFNGADSVIEIPLRNVSVSQFFAYPMARLHLKSALPIGMSFHAGSHDYSVFASSFNPGDEYPVSFFFKVNQAIPPNFMLHCELYGKFHPGDPNPDTCVFSPPFYINLNPQSTGIQQLNEKSLLSIYPNPAVNRLFVVSSHKKSVYQILNFQGVVLVHTVCESQESIDISMLPQGMYVLKRIAENGENSFGKFIKMELD